MSLTNDPSLDTPAMDYQERLEHLDNNNGEKSDYMTLISEILHSLGTPKSETDTIIGAIESYSQSK